MSEETLERAKQLETKFNRSVLEKKKKQNKKSELDRIKRSGNSIDLTAASGLRAKQILFVFRPMDYEKTPSDIYHKNMARRIYNMFISILPSGTYKALDELMREKSLRI